MKAKGREEGRSRDTRHGVKMLDNLDGGNRKREIAARMMDETQRDRVALSSKMTRSKQVRRVDRPNSQPYLSVQQFSLDQ